MQQPVLLGRYGPASAVGDRCDARAMRIVWVSTQEGERAAFRFRVISLAGERFDGERSRLGFELAGREGFRVTFGKLERAREVAPCERALHRVERLDLASQR